MLDLFRGEKSVLFYIGLIILGYSIYQFFFAGWQLAISYLTFPSYNSDAIVMQWFYVVPSIVQGIIWLIIGLFIMKVGTVKKELKAET